MIALLRTALTLLVTLVLTLCFAAVLLVAVLLRVPHAPDSVYVRLPRLWCGAILWAAGVTVRVHGLNHLPVGQPLIFISNHVSLFDIPTLVMSLPQHYFVAKAELFDIPIFGPAIRATGAIPIQRDNKMAARTAYDVGAARVREGASVVVFPEGTRGTSYAIRPFKKGPFVFAIRSGVPVVPCIVHGTIEVLPRQSILVHPGTVDLHILQPIPTAGLDYGARDLLAREVNQAMARAMTTLYPTT